MNALKTEVSDLKSTVTKLEKSASYLLNKVDDLENRSRRNNLIIYGLEEPSEETSEELTDALKKQVFEEKLGIAINGIERCHRLGKKKDNDRPVIIKLQDYREKISILKTCKKLKGTKFSVTEDFSYRIRNLRKKLWQSSSEERASGAKVKLIFDKLSIDNVMYAWNENEDRRFKIPKHNK